MFICSSPVPHFSCVSFPYFRVFFFCISWHLKNSVSPRRLFALRVFSFHFFFRPVSGHWGRSCLLRITASCPPLHRLVPSCLGRSRSSLGSFMPWCLHSLQNPAIRLTVDLWTRCRPSYQILHMWLTADFIQRKCWQRLEGCGLSTQRRIRRFETRPSRNIQMTRSENYKKCETMSPKQLVQTV